MIVTFVNNDGGGGVDELNVPNGTTVGAFIQQYMPGFNSGRHQARVNRESSNPDDILTEGDHIAVMPTKVGGGS